MPDALRTAAIAFTASADLAANAAIIRSAIADAARSGTKLLLTPECSLLGYPSAVRDNLSAVDWCLLADLEDQLALAAEKAGMVVVLGTAGQHGGGYANEALAVGAGAPVRYRKQCLTPSDRAHFVACSQAAVVDVAGWRIGLAICYDLRFPDVWATLAASGADGFAVIAHMAGPDPDPGTKRAVIPGLCAMRAAEWATPLLFANTAAADRYCDSGAWDARGLPTASCANGLFIAELTPRDALDPWYRGLRDTALARWRSACERTS